MPVGVPSVPWTPIYPHIVCIHCQNIAVPFLSRWGAKIRYPWRFGSSVIQSNKCFMRKIKQIKSSIFVFELQWFYFNDWILLGETIISIFVSVDFQNHSFDSFLSPPISIRKCESKTKVKATKWFLYLSKTEAMLHLGFKPKIKMAKELIWERPLFWWLCSPAETAFSSSGHSIWHIWYLIIHI